MKRIILATLLLAALVGSVSADPRRYLGRPNIDRGVMDKFYVWGNDNGRFNVRVTSNNRNAIMVGVIRAWNGAFTDVRLVRREVGDFLRVSQNGDFLYFRFRVSRRVDGFDFLTDATALSIRFEVDGKKARPAQIHLGRLEMRPVSNPFALGITEDSVENIGEFVFNPSMATVEIESEIPESELDEASR